MYNKKLIFSDYVIYVSMVILMIIMLYPFLYIISMSLSTKENITSITFYPKGFNINAYRFILNLPSVINGYRNTVVYTVLYTLIAITLTMLCAYPLSKKWLPGRTYLTIFIVITMFFSGGLIPLFITVSRLGMMDTIWAILIPGALNSWLMIITRTFFLSIPVELDESAYVDGANEFTILTRIYLQLSQPIIATLSLFYAVAKWNSWFDASIYLSSQTRYPIQLILRNLMVTRGGGGFEMSDMSVAIAAMGGMSARVDPRILNYALIVAVILPIVFVYPFLQKYFVKGVMIGSLKG